MIEAGYVPPFFYQVDQQEQGGDAKEDPPEDIRDELLEQFPAGQVGVADDLACGGTVEPVILSRGAQPGFLLRVRLDLRRLGREIGIGAEEQVKTLHSNRWIGCLAFLDVDVDFFGGKHLAADHAGEVEAEVAWFSPGAVGSQEDLVSLAGQGGLDVISGGVERVDSDGLSEDRQWGGLGFVRFGDIRGGFCRRRASHEDQVKVDVAGARLVVDSCRQYVFTALERSRGNLDRAVPVYGFMVNVLLVDLLTVDPDGR